MTTTDYWKKEIDKASELAPPYLPAKGELAQPDPEIVAALLIAGQLQSITTVLAEIRNQLDQIEDSISNN